MREGGDTQSIERRVFLKGIAVELAKRPELLHLIAQAALGKVATKAGIESLKEDLRTYTDARYNDLTARISALEKHISGLRSDIESFKRSIKEDMNALKNDLKAYIDAKYDDLAARIDSLDKQIDSLDKRIDALDKRIDALGKRIDGLDKRMDFLQRMFYIWLFIITGLLLAILGELMLGWLNSLNYIKPHPGNHIRT